MSQNDIKVFEIKRLLFGDLPEIFLVEIVFRSLVMYLFLLLMIRLLGKRALNQLSLFEFSIIIALGSAVGDPMFYEDVPLLHGMTVIAAIVLFQRFLTYLTERNQKLEDIIEGKVRCLIRDGVIYRNEVGKEALSREEMFSALRAYGVENLGQVKRAYIEASGDVSIFKYKMENNRFGLPILPLDDEKEKVKQGTVVNGLYSCCMCGWTENFSAALPECPKCKNDSWTQSEKCEG